MRILFLLCLPIALANFLLVLYNVPIELHDILEIQILICLLFLGVLCLLEAICPPARLLLVCAAYAGSFFLCIGPHIIVCLFSGNYAETNFSITWLPNCICHICIVFSLYQLPYPFRCFLAAVDCGLFLLLLTFISQSDLTGSVQFMTCQPTIILVNVIALFLIIIFIAWIVSHFWNHYYRTI